MPLVGITDPKVPRDVSSIELTVNGETVSLQKYDETTTNVPLGYWWTTHDFPAGADVKLVAKADKAEDISASITIPKAFPDFQAEGTAYPSVTVRFKDDGSTEDCYGIWMVAEFTVRIGGETRVIIQGCQPLAESEEFGRETVKDYIDIQIQPRDYTSTIRLWPDTKFNGGDAELTYSAYSYYDGHYTEEPDSVEARYKAYLFRISPEYFKYAVTLNHIDNNMLASLGLAPASYAYSNITNGLGVLAGAAVAETNWFE